MFKQRNKIDTIEFKKRSPEKLKKFFEIEFHSNKEPDDESLNRLPEFNVALKYSFKKLYLSSELMSVISVIGNIASGLALTGLGFEQLFLKYFKKMSGASRLTLFVHPRGKRYIRRRVFEHSRHPRRVRAIVLTIALRKLIRH